MTDTKNPTQNAADTELPKTFGDLSPDAQKRAVGGAMSKLISATIGEVVVVMSRASSHKHYSLTDIEWMVLPPVLAGQVYVAEAQHNELGTRAPVAAITWARVSEEVDARLTQAESAMERRLKPEEWTSGDIHWLMDLVGDPRGVAGGLKALREGPLKDREVKVAVVGQNGARSIDTLKSSSSTQSPQTNAGARSC